MSERQRIVHDGFERGARAFGGGMRLARSGAFTLGREELHLIRDDVHSRTPVAFPVGIFVYLDAACDRHFPALGEIGTAMLRGLAEGHDAEEVRVTLLRRAIGSESAIDGC